MASAQPRSRDRRERPGPPTRDGQSGSHDRWPRAPAFVPAHLIRDVPATVLAVALHRDAAGFHRSHCSAMGLAAAVRSGQVACDPLTVRWLPPRVRADALMRDAWGRRTGHEGPAHRSLRGAAAVLLAAWFPGGEVEPEQPVHAQGRCVRPDLLVRGPDGCGVAAEVGTVEGDAILALLRTAGRGGAVCRSVSHVVALPFAGQGATVSRGYLFRFSGTAPLPALEKQALRSAWSALRRRPPGAAGDAR